MKKDSFKIPFKSNFFKEQDPFHLVIIFFIIFFGTAIFFSIPTFYDYKKYNQQIEDTINKDFKINIHNLDKISFRFIPSPHLLIKKADLKIKKSESKPISQLKNIKVFISITDFYKKESFEIDRIVVNKANIYLDKISLKHFIGNLKKNIVKNFIIKKSTFFFKNKNDEIILLSKIKNFNYKIDYVNTKKILKINGNIFDSEYEFKYLIDYKFPNIQNLIFELKNPNIILENKLSENISSKNLSQTGNLIIRFLTNKNIITYKIKDNDIEFLGNNPKNTDFDIKGKINFKPFHFDLEFDNKQIDLINLENILYIIHNNQILKYENLSGKLKINFNNIDNKILNSGLFELNFNDTKLYTEKNIFNLGDFATLEISEYDYLKEIDQIVQMKIKINILDYEKFNRFLFNYRKKRFINETIYFTYQFNANTQNHFISTISNKGFFNSSEFYKFNNLQQLKNLLIDENIFKMDWSFFLD